MHQLFTRSNIWINGIFKFLDFASIKLLSSVNRFLHSLSREITHPSHLGNYPISFWINQVLPLLSYQDLKKFQTVSQGARRLTLTKKLAKVMFRSDAIFSTLKRIEPGTKIETNGKGFGSVGINPFIAALTYCVGDGEDQLFTERKIHGGYYGPNNSQILKMECMQMMLYGAKLENATEPPVPVLFIENYDHKFLTVEGTGKPRYGGKLPTVTCQNVMLALTRDCQRFQHGTGEDERRSYAGFGSFSRVGEHFVLADLSWDTLWDQVFKNTPAFFK